MRTRCKNVPVYCIFDSNSGLSLGHTVTIVATNAYIITVDGLVRTSQEYKAPNFIFVRMFTIIVRRHHECQRILYDLVADFSRFHHNMLRYTTI